MIKTILARVRQYKAVSLWTIFFTMAEVALEIFIPFIMGNIIDYGIKAENINYVYKYGAIMLLVSLLSLFSGVMAGRLAAKASTGIACNLRNDMFDNIQTYSFANIDKYSTAGLVTRLTTDVTNIQNAYQMILRMCIRAPFTLICALVMSFSISVKISLLFVVVMIFLSIVLGLVIKNVMPLFNEVFKKYDDLNSSIQENVSAIRVVKAFVREDYENKKFEKAAGNIYKMFVKAEGILAFNNPAMSFSVYTCIIIISWVGANMVVSNELTTGNISSLLSYVMNILISLMMLSMVFVMITMSVASARRIAEVINEKSDLISPENAVTKVENGSVEFSNVSFSYNKDSKKAVLKDINLKIKPGETIGIIGGTGSSKSSLVNLISRLYDVTEGVVKVGGRNVKEYDIEVLRNEVAVVLQKNELFSGTILDNLRWGKKDATLEECKRVCRMACADEFIERFPDKYDTYIEQGGNNVSGGQKQRLCIARALLKKPKILILDDSTSAVDMSTDAKIRKAFIEEIPDTTKFIIAQRISSVKDADRIIVLEDGRIDGFDTHENLIKTNEIYRAVYEGQLSGNGDFDEN